MTEFQSSDIAGTGALVREGGMEKVVSCEMERLLAGGGWLMCARGRSMRSRMAQSRRLEWMVVKGDVQLGMEVNGSASERWKATEGVTQVCNPRRHSQ